MISDRSRSDVYRNLVRIEDGETVIEVVKVGNRRASIRACRGCKMKQVEPKQFPDNWRPARHFDSTLFHARI